MIHLSCRPKERPGVLREHFQSVLPLNIALAEAVTIDSGLIHHVNLILEPYVGQTTVHQDHLSDLRERLRNAGFSDIEARPYPPRPPIVWSCVVRINHGWVYKTGWREEIAARTPKDDLGKIDLTTAVLSADTDLRVLRYVFPFKGAKTVHIEHNDIPGALKTLTDAIYDCDLNILSAILRRGGAQPRSAVLVAICEPTADSCNVDIVQKIKARIKQIDVKFRPICHPPYDARAAAGTINVRHPDALVAHVPEELLPLVLAERQKLQKGKRPVFFSRRFFPDNPRAQRIEDRVRKVLNEHRCTVLESTPRPHLSPQIAFTDVSSKLWVSRAGIVLVMGSGQPPTEDAFSANLAHEFGFLQGQGKPVLVLVERGQSEALREWSIASGLITPHIRADQSAFDPDDPSSIDRVLIEWINALNQKYGNVPEA